MDEFFKLILCGFIAGNWSAFAGHCESLGVNPDDVYKELGGDPE